MADSGLHEAIQHFERAIALEPGFSAAWASLAGAHVASAEYGREQVVVALDAARRAAARALALDHTLSGAHVATGDAYRILDWDWSRAEGAYGMALSFNPSSESAHRRMSLLLAALGRADEAEAAAERVRELDPLCLTNGSATAWSSYLIGSSQRAIERSRIVLDIDPSFDVARRVLSASLLALGRHDEAIAALADGHEAREAAPISSLWMAHALAAAGRTTEATALVDRVSHSGRPHVPGYHVAIAQLGVGRIDAALAALELASEQRDPALMQLVAEPRLRPLHGEPRFRALVRRLSLPTTGLVSASAYDTLAG